MITSNLPTLGLKTCYDLHKVRTNRNYLQVMSMVSSTTKRKFTVVLSPRQRRWSFTHWFLLLTHSCLAITLTSVVWTSDTSENNFWNKHKFKKIFEEELWVGFWSIFLLQIISEKCSDWRDIIKRVMFWGRTSIYELIDARSSPMGNPTQLDRNEVISK